MHIYYKDRKLEKWCNSEAEAIKKWGKDNARKILTRLLELKAANTLADISTLPPARCHALTNNRAGEYAVTAKEPYRVIFEPYHDPIPKLPDGGVDKSRVTAIKITEVVDYHV